MTRREWYPVREVLEFVEGTTWSRLSISRVGRGEAAGYEWMLQLDNPQERIYWSLAGRATSVDDALTQAEAIMDERGAPAP